MHSSKKEKEKKHDAALAVLHKSKKSETPVYISAGFHRRIISYIIIQGQPQHLKHARHSGTNLQSL